MCTGIKSYNQLDTIFGGKELCGPLFNYCKMDEYYVFDFNGDIYSCPQAIGNKDEQVGQYFPELFLEDRKRETIFNNGFIRCEKCAVAPICGGGCPYKRHSYKKNGVLKFVIMMKF